MKGSIFRKLALSILSMNLSQNELLELEDLLRDRRRTQELLDVCYEIRRVLDAQSGQADWALPHGQVSTDVDHGKLWNVVSTMPDLTTKRLAEIVQWVCGREIRPGKTSKLDYVRKLQKQLTEGEMGRVSENIMAIPRSREGKGIDEWFQQMSQRIHAK